MPNYYTIAIITALLVLAGIAYYLHLELQAWALVKTDTEPRLIYRGWEIIRALWPSLMLMAVGLASPMYFAGKYMGKELARMDLAQQQQEAQRAQKNASETLAQAQELQRQAMQTKFKAEQETANAKAQVETIKAQSVQHANEMTFRAKNAICAAERIKRKQKRISER